MMWRGVWVHSYTDVNVTLINYTIWTYKHEKLVMTGSLAERVVQVGQT